MAIKANNPTQRELLTTNTDGTQVYGDVRDRKGNLEYRDDRVVLKSDEPLNLPKQMAGDMLRAFLTKIGSKAQLAEDIEQVELVKSVVTKATEPGALKYHYTYAQPGQTAANLSSAEITAFFAATPA